MARRDPPLQRAGHGDVGSQALKIDAATRREAGMPRRDRAGRRRKDPVIANIDDVARMRIAAGLRPDHGVHAESQQIDARRNRFVLDEAAPRDRCTRNNSSASTEDAR
ncbi:hypothetical protein [Burkholderia perseverans]|uniref:hypothetical protein n=1 Tax=Burkholderia perseverans TaxID=2615214 RepID=UPI001FED7AC0|nr:hypothetical protein [Burkholderia perseverans]